MRRSTRSASRTRASITSAARAPEQPVDTPGAFAASRQAAGQLAIHASAGELVAEAGLVVRAELVIVDPGAPPGAGALATVEPQIELSRAPSLLYPADGALLPQAMAPLTIEHALGTGNDVARVRFVSDLIDIRVLACRATWVPSAALWNLISASHPGDELRVEIAAGSSGALYAGAPHALAFARSPILGSITYWSGATSGVMHTTLDRTQATSWYPPGTCVGCHVASRDGTQVAFGFDGEKLRSVRTDDLGTIVDNRAPMGWATFSPDNRFLLVADRGTLTLRDAVTGAEVGPDRGRVPLPNGLKATHPDWSPDGTSVAVTLAPGINANTDVVRGSIAVIPYDDGVWGPTEVVVPSTGNFDNNYFPRWSPDGKLLAFVHARGPSKQATSADLHVIDPVTRQRGGLDRANVSGAGSTMPSWAAGDGDVAWLLFSSTRPHAGSSISQIWIAGVATSVTPADDMSFAAFRLPAQDPSALCNNPIWIPVQPVISVLSPR